MFDTISPIPARPAVAASLDELFGRSAGLAVEARRDTPPAPCSSTTSLHSLREQLNRTRLTDRLRLELPLGTCSASEKVGIKLDTRRLEEAATRIRADAQQLERDIWEMAGEEFMIGSPQQLAEVLFVKLGLSRKRRGKTGFSTDARVLQAIRDEHPIIPKIERFRELTKLVQTYPTPAAGSGPTAACTRPSCRRTPPRGAWRRSTRTSRTSRSAPRPAA